MATIELQPVDATTETTPAGTRRIGGPTAAFERLDPRLAIGASLLLYLGLHAVLVLGAGFVAVSVSGGFAGTASLLAFLGVGLPLMAAAPSLARSLFVRAVDGPWA